MKNPLDKCILKKIANVFVVQSNYFLKLLVNLGIPKSKIKIVLNGIDVEKFKPSSDLKIENLILFVGRLDPKKGLPVLLKALEYLRTKVHLIIIGPPSRPWFFKYCLSLIDKVSKNTIHKVTYLGTCSQEKLIKWYQKASVLVCPSLSELFPMVILEALSCATPVIATNVGAIPEIVKNYENGILVPPRNAMRLSEAIQYLLDNRKIRLKFGEDGRKFVFKNFSSKVVTEKLVEIYMDLLKVQFA
jgi:glycosyltransferase involved in cell wall biosynthesis